MGVIGQVCAEAESVAFVVGVGLIRRVNGDLLLFVARPPASLVGGLPESNAIEPGAQAGFAMEAANAAKDLDEDFLGDVGGVGGGVGASRDQRIERLRILRSQGSQRPLETGFQIC